MPNLINFISYTIGFGVPACLGIFSLYKAIILPFTPQFPVSTLPDRILLAVPWFLFTIAIEIILGFITGANKIYRLNDFLSSIYQGTLQLLSIKLLFRSLALFPYIFIYENYRVVDLKETPKLWILTFFLIEWGYYWLHRLAHEVNLFWAGHVVHHNSEEYNLSTALRQGILQASYGWIFYLPLAFFIPIKLFHFHNQWNTLYQFWIHTQLIKKLPFPIEYFFNTPSHHRVHHGRNPKYLDKNYGGTLIIYDRIFKTFQPEEEEVIYGITHELNTWNPIYIQSHHLIETWEAASKTEGFFEKILVWISPSYGPSYNYLTLYDEDRKKIQETQENGHSFNSFFPDSFSILSSENKQTENDDNSVPPRPKYDNTVPNIYMSCYGFFHSVILVGISVGIVATPLSFLNALFLILLAVFGIISISLLFDFPTRSYAKTLELTRLGVYVLLGNYFIRFHLQPEKQLNVILILDGLYLLSVIWLAYFYDPQIEQPKSKVQ